jgi:hypothetical protein
VAFLCGSVYSKVRAALLFFRPPHRGKPRSSERDDAEASLAAGAGRALYHDFDVAAEQGQELHESLCGEARKLPAASFRGRSQAEVK